MEELLDDGALGVDDLEACDVGSAGEHLVQAYVGEALEKRKNFSGWRTTRFRRRGVQRGRKGLFSISPEDVKIEISERTHQIGEDVMVTSAVFPQGHHLQRGKESLR